MSVYKSGEIWQYNFWWQGKHIRASTHQKNKREAERMQGEERNRLIAEDRANRNKAAEAGCKPEELARCVECEKLFNVAAAVTTSDGSFCGETCASKWAKDHRPAPTLKEFAQRFVDEIQVRCKGKPNTIEFYAIKLKRLLEFEPLASARLERIDEELISSYVQNRSTQVSQTSINRELATLRRLLRIAHEWQIIDRVPKVRLNLKAERTREFVFSHGAERNYLEFAPQPIRDAALLLLDTGLRIGELLALRWADVHLQPVGDARFGYIQIRKGKSLNARRNLSLTPRVRAMLETRQAGNKSAWVFTDESGTSPLSIYTLEDQHRRMRDRLKLPADAVIHSFRHTFGTRLGEAGADAFTIMKAMGHSSVVVSQKYVHPTPEAMERAFERLNAANEKAMASLPNAGDRKALEGQNYSASTKISTKADRSGSEAVSVDVEKVV